MSLPTDLGLNEIEPEEFHPAIFLTAQIKLCDLKAEVLNITGQLSSDTSAITSQISNIIQKLADWQINVGSKIGANAALQSASSTDLPRTMRTAASLFLKYNQVM